MYRERNFVGLVIYFENTDMVVLSPADVACLEIKGVKEKISYNGYNEEVNHEKEAERVYLRLTSKAKLRLLKDSLIPFGDWLGHFHDITEIAFRYDDGSIEEVLLPWKEEDKDSENPRQRNLFGQDGQVTIFIDSEAYPFSKEAKL